MANTCKLSHVVYMLLSRGLLLLHVVIFSFSSATEDELCVKRKTSAAIKTFDDLLNESDSKKKRNSISKR